MHYQKRLNPYNSRPRESFIPTRIRSWVIGITIGAIAVVLLALLPIWQLKAVEVSGSVNPGIPLQKTIADFFDTHDASIVGPRNLIFLNTKDLKKTLQSAYGTDAVDVEKDFPHTIAISINYSGVSTVFVARGVSYGLDAYGKITGPVNTRSPNTLTIYDSGAMLPTVGAEVVRPAFLQLLKTIQNHDEFRGYRIAYALVPTPTDKATLTLATDKGFRIIIDSGTDLGEQLSRMNRIVTSVVGPSKIETLDYIDLRYKEKVFYKTK